MQRAQIMADNSGPSIDVTSPPQFSAKAGGVSTGTKVSISCPTQNAVIYYTTTGWTPTTSSRRYTGPVTLLATTQLQAFAVAPNMANSTYTSASYTVKGPPLTVFPLAISADGVLHAKIRLHLATNSTVSSKKCKGRRQDPHLARSGCQSWRFRGDSQRDLGRRHHHCGNSIRSPRRARLDFLCRPFLSCKRNDCPFTGRRTPQWCQPHDKDCPLVGDICGVDSSCDDARWRR
jgi:Chitobiase/beta-hexosaminidase C-terminal domain